MSNKFWTNITAFLFDEEYKLWRKGEADGLTPAEVRRLHRLQRLYEDAIVYRKRARERERKMA